MSYILDALRKADAQRERDPARGIHAQALPVPGSRVERRNGAGPLIWPAAAIAVAMLAWGGWRWYQGSAGDAAPNRPPAQLAARPAANPGASPAQPPQPVAVVGMPATNAVALAAPIPAAAIDPPAPPVRPSIAAPADGRPGSLPNARGSQTGAAERAPGARMSRPDLVAQAQVQVPGAAASAAQAPVNSAFGAATPGAPPAVGSIPSPRLSGQPLTLPGAPAMAAQPGTPPPPPPPVAVVVPQPPVAGLPADAPKLAVSGGVYSTNPAQRMLIVNGQVFNEGSEVAPGVVLDEIKSKTAVLRFRGARYTVTF